MNLKKQLFPVLGISLLCASAQAALPPPLERARELKDVIESVQDILDSNQHPQASGMIDAVAYVGEDDQAIYYKVTSGKCVLDVRLVIQHSYPLMPGPTPYKVVPSKTLHCAE